MRILFTGASSFTGFWFARELAEAGHQVIATFQQGRTSYSGIRAERVERLITHIEPVWNCSFGDQKFVETIHSYDSWDLLCHHAADVTDYKSADFDILSALSSNTRDLRSVLAAAVRASCARVIVTGSVFEPGEGAGSEQLPAFSPYGLSKSLSWQIFSHYCREIRLPIAKFVIPNPFGPFEEERFTAYLVNTWRRGDIAKVNTPEYIRDNIHVSLLAKAYAAFVDNMKGMDSDRMCPTGYIESQGQFALRVASEVRRRSTLDCGVEIAEQIDFTEPRIRINTDVFDQHGWSESASWDEFCAYYLEGTS